MKFVICLTLIGLILLSGCKTNCEDICYLRGNMDGSEVNIQSSSKGECVFPFNYTVKESDNLNIVIEEHCRSSSAI